MARKRKIITQSDQRTKPEDEDIETAEAGDFCYFLNERNKISWGNITKVFKERGMVGFQVVCQSEYRYYSIPHLYCSFSEKALKGKKREHFKIDFRAKI